MSKNVLWNWGGGNNYHFFLLGFQHYGIFLLKHIFELLVLLDQLLILGSVEQIELKTSALEFMLAELSIVRPA